MRFPSRPSPFQDCNKYKEDRHNLPHKSIPSSIHPSHSLGEFTLYMRTIWEQFKWASLSCLYSFIMQADYDVFFFRHGESQKNEAAHNYQHQRGLDFNWELFCQDPVFLETVTHNPKLIDSHLSQKGVQQCLTARAKLADFHPDLILVSPLQRALETCRLLLGEKQAVRIVEPLLSETFKHSSEICRSIPLKKAEFAEFDFSRVEAEGEFWFIRNDSPENQAKYFQFLREMEGEYSPEQGSRIAAFMQQERMAEGAANVRLRAQKVKALLREYRKQYKCIAIVSHFYTIRFLCCNEFDQNDEPIDRINMGNCELYPARLADIAPGTA